jgi:lysozyme
VNDHHRLNEYGLDLLTCFEKGDASVVPLTPGGAAMEPYVCPGDMLTIGYGCTKWFGGRDVLPTDRLSDEASARALLAEQVIEYEDAVRKWVTVPLNSNQFSALVCFAFNVGIKALSGSTLLRHINASRFDDAAEAFGMWIYATSGQHKRALRGLLRRRYAEALLGMGYQFDEACDDDFIRLKVKRPPNNIGTDQVEFKTPFKDVLIIAQRYPLPPLDEPELVLSTPIKAEPAVVPIASKAGQPVPLPGPAPAAPAIKTSASGSSEATPVALPVPAPQPTPARPAPASVPAVIPAPAGTKAKSPNTVAPAEVPYKIDPQAGLKPLEESDRAKGYWYQQAGIGMIRLGSLGVFGTTVQGGAQVLQGDPVLSNLVLTGVVVGGIAATGYVVKAYGDWRRKRGEKAAVQALY